MRGNSITRRTWWRQMAGYAAVAAGPWAGGAERLPHDADHMRATDGDSVGEPRWDKQWVLTVGNREGDLQGTDDRVVQAAVDTVARRGGGTVQLLPGTFTFRNAVVLPSRIRLRGSGPDTLLTKIASETQPLAADSDWYDQEITLAQAAGFQVGDGVALQARNPDHGGPIVIKRTLIAQSGNRFKLNDGLRDNLWLSGEPHCSSLFPLLTSEFTSDVVIENLTLDGNGANNVNFNGNYGGCIFLQDCQRYTLRQVEARNYNGDGISFQVCHDVLVEDCYSHDNYDLGVHPGSGSQRPIVRNNRLERNSQGIFWCWGVKFGLAERNQIRGNRDYGISIGHCDTDNLMRDNEIVDSGKVGILFRDDPRGQDFWPHRNRLERNRIVNSGDEQGVAIDITGRPRDLVLQGNQILEQRAAANRIGIRIGKDVGSVSMSENVFAGLAQDVVDQR